MTKFSTNCLRPYLILSTILLLTTNDISCNVLPVQERNGVCSSSECEETASRVLGYIDKTTEPCDNFYQFACGNFVEQSVIPDDKPYIWSFTQVQDDLKKKLRTLVENPLSNDLKPFSLFQKSYNSCMNEELVEADGSQTIRETLRGLGGWPVLEGSEWKEDEFDWKRLLVNLHISGYGIPYLFQIYVIPDFKNSSKSTLFLDELELPARLNRNDMIDGMENSKMKIYSEYMVDIAVMFGADREYAIEQLEESLEFELNLMTMLPHERYDPEIIHNPMSVQELQEKYVTIPWQQFINHLLIYSNVTTNINDVLIVTNPKYISQMEILLNNSDKRVQANYIMWRVIEASIEYLSKEFRARKVTYVESLTGETKEQPRWIQCIDFVTKYMGVAAGAVYVRSLFDQQAKKNAVDIVSEIHSEIDDILGKVVWMDEVTRAHALEKAQAMLSNIAYPDELLDDGKLVEHYAELELSSELYLEVSLALNEFANKQNYKKLGVPINKTYWADQSVAVVDAYYNVLGNTMDFPAGIFDGLFFHKDRPRYMNYGAIGFVVGHEMTHGFDTIGNQFDKNGNMANWWENDTYGLYINTTDCVTNHYKTYFVPEVGLNLTVEVTQAEDIADIGGAKISYLAYKNWLKRNEPEDRLPGLEEYSPEQMFWISNAHLFCAKFRPEALRDMILNDRHSPPKFRVLGTLSNNNDFSTDFNCPANSNMNVENKCVVW